MHGGQQRLQLRSAKVRPLALSPIFLRGGGYVFFLRAFLRAFGVDARRWLRWILNPPRRSFKLRVLVDRQRPMKNVTLDRTTVLQLDVDGTDSALDAAADCHVLRNDVALDLCAARTSPSIRPKTCAGPLHSMLPTIDMSEPMQEAVPAFVVGSDLAQAWSCGCTVPPMTSGALPPRSYPSRVRRSSCYSTSPPPCQSRCKKPFPLLVPAGSPRPVQQPSVAAAPSPHDFGRI